MSVISMTGFGRGTTATTDRTVTVELSTVNRKQFDCSVSLPREWVSFEPRIQARIRTRVSRGYVKVNISVTAQPNAQPQIHPERFTGQISALRAYAAAFALADDLSAKDLLRLPDLLRSMDSLEATPDQYTTLENALDQALDGLTAMRRHEGDHIAADIRQRLAGLDSLRAKIAETAPGIPTHYRDTLLRRISELLATANTHATDEQIAREVALFADRCDISEELTRLQAHFAHAHTLLNDPAPCGRSLDFLCQELFREINTTGSKATHTGITQTVIAFKALLETLREQIQNIE